MTEINAAGTEEAPFVTVCLTAIASRLDIVEGTIVSLLAQDHPHFAVRLHLSREPFLLDEGVPGALPAGLEALAAQDPRFSIRFVPNIGPYRKILPLLVELGGRRALVATADDDTRYPPDWLSGLVAAWQRWRCVVAYRGHYMVRRERKLAPYRRWMTDGIARNPDLFAFPTGKDGVLYDTALLHPGVTDIAAALRVAPTADDLWLKWHTAALDVPTFLIHTDYTTQSLEGGSLEDSLYTRFNRGGGNTAAVERLEAYATERLGFNLAARF